MILLGRVIFLITGSNKKIGSIGKYYSFGNKGSYTMIDDVSVGQYIIKKIQIL